VRRLDHAFKADSRGGAFDIQHADSVISSPPWLESEAYDTVTRPAGPSRRKQDIRLETAIWAEFERQIQVTATGDVLADDVEALFENERGSAFVEGPTARMHGRDYVMREMADDE